MLRARIAEQLSLKTDKTSKDSRLRELLSHVIVSSTKRLLYSLCVANCYKFD